MLNQRERAILELIRDNPLISQAAIASRLELKRSSVAGYIMHLQRKGLIRGRGYLLNEPRYVAVLGGANIDIEGRSAAKLRHRDSNIGSVRRSAGGVARNIAENLARLAIPTRLLTALSDDDEGVWLRDETSRAGVDLADVVWSRHRQTASYVSILDEHGEMVLAVNDMGILDELDAAAIRERPDQSN